VSLTREVHAAELNGCARACGSRFNPDVLFNTGSSCFGLLIFEFIIFRGGLLFFNAEAPPKLDSFAITGYKFVSYVVQIVRRSEDAPT
jgi:hypothetical protein